MKSSNLARLAPFFSTRLCVYSRGGGDRSTWPRSRQTYGLSAKAKRHDDRHSVLLGAMGRIRRACGRSFRRARYCRANVTSAIQRDRWHVDVTRSDGAVCLGCRLDRSGALAHFEWLQQTSRGRIGRLWHGQHRQSLQCLGLGVAIANWVGRQVSLYSQRYLQFWAAFLFLCPRCSFEAKPKRWPKISGLASRAWPGCCRSSNSTVGGFVDFRSIFPVESWNVN